MTTSRRFLVAALGLAIASASHSQPPVSELSVPYPDLGSMEATAREKVESMQAALDRLQSDPESPRSDLAEGFGYLGRLFHAFSLLDAAEVCYTNAESLLEQDHRWPYFLGLVRNRGGDFDRAVADYERALVLRPDDSTILLRLGNVLLGLNRGPEARAYFRRAIEAGGESAAAHYGLGKVSAMNGDHRGAVKAFETALTLEPEAGAVHYSLAQAFRKLGDLDRARTHLRQRGEERPRIPDPLGNQISQIAKSTAFEVALALARDGDRFSARDFLGFALAQFGDVQGAIEQVEHGLLLLRESTTEETSSIERARIHYLLGGLLVNDLRDDEAIEHFSNAVELDPTLLDARIKWGNCLARGRQFEAAAKLYGEVLRSDPTHTAALLKRASALTEAGRAPEARPDLEALLESEPDHAEAHVRLAAILVESGDIDLGIEHYRRATQLEQAVEQQVQTWIQLAALLRGQGRLEEALSSFRRAAEADPESLPALNGTAGLLAQAGRFAEAANGYAVLVALQPGDLVARVREVTALIFDGQHEKGRTRLEEGLVALPEELTLKDILARHLAACPDLEVRNGERALELALEVYEQAPTLESMETLAMAHAEIQDFEEAIRWQEKALEKAATTTDGPRREHLERNLERYRQGQACCAVPR